MLKLVIATNQTIAKNDRERGRRLVAESNRGVDFNKFLSLSAMNIDIL